MTVPREAHVRALKTLLKYITHTKDRGLVIAPRDLWSTGYKSRYMADWTWTKLQILTIIEVVMVGEFL